MRWRVWLTYSHLFICPAPNGEYLYAHIIKYKYSPRVFLYMYVRTNMNTCYSPLLCYRNGCIPQHCPVPCIFKIHVETLFDSSISKKPVKCYSWFKVNDKPLWKTVWSFLTKLERELLYSPVILLLGIYPKNIKHQFEELYTPLCLLQHYLQ